MTAHKSGASRRVVVRRSKSTKPKWQPPSLPEKPKVTLGPKCFGETRKGKYIVCRFYIGPNKKNWVVWDFEDGIAKGTPREGYANKQQAIDKAREYRDKFGAWASSPF